MSDFAALWDWRRRVFASYAAVRAAADPVAGWRTWRAERDALFAGHAQSPVALGGGALPFAAYDPAWRFAVALVPVAGAALVVDAGEDGAVRLVPFARTAGLAAALGRELTVFWVGGYGGGALLPFADAWEGSYGGGRYVLDTIKGADLGMAGGLTVVDFNYAYNPSCAYSGRFVCPLAPAGNRVGVRVVAGERVGAGVGGS